MVPFRTVLASLADVVGAPFVEAVCEARAALSGENPRDLLGLARERIDWYPADFHQRLLSHLPRVGEQISTGTTATAAGATTQAFAAASKRATAPLTGYGFYRVGEDGRLFLTTKSEHYHAPVGHAFPGYALLETARRLGLPNATHNNTRGHVTRLLEESLVRAADGPSTGLTHVLNLETGSLAAEAAVKMMLARFLAPEPGMPKPKYQGRVPVFLVMGNDEGELLANYHGTTVATQMLRGMWSELLMMMETEGILKIVALRPNSMTDLDDAFAMRESGIFKIAGFLHEIVMMNYGARLLSREFLRYAYHLCERYDVPTFVDEIQTGLWAPGLLMFREWGLKPSLVALGKGFPGGEYPASRLLCNDEMDDLPQFGALVTNGQEEIASLAYLVTMRWAEENTEVVREIGDLYEERMRDLAGRYPAIVSGINGSRHLLGLEFHDIGTAQACCEALNRGGLDISAHTYKSECPPVALTKLPITACATVVEFVVERVRAALDELNLALRN